MSAASTSCAAALHQRVARRIAAINVLVRAHAGEVELVDAACDGTVTVRFTGMCAGCDYRPVTTAGTVEPALLDVPGVARVVVRGAAVSEEARSRIADTVGAGEAAARAIRLARRIEAGLDVAHPGGGPR